jgi:hypothetical protein
MLRSRLFHVVSLGLFVLGSLMECPAADWPQWRYDARRSARSPGVLPDRLHLQWQRDYEPLKPAFWQVRQERVQFDLGYEPVVAGKTLLVGSSRNDRVTALDTETGDERWRFYTDGPVRLAPAIWQGKVYFASDDGCMYCLDVERGNLLWKQRAAPSQRKVMGNGRLISVWPARGGPVVADGRVYFAAGVWPFEGIFVYALDAGTGDVIWMNDRCGSLYLTHPHGAPSFGGPAPQGYCLIQGDRLVVPSSRAFPAFFDLETGKLTKFAFGYAGHGSVPGGWFVASDAEGRLVVDPEINTEGHDLGQQTIGQPGIRRAEGEPLRPVVNVGGKTYQIEAGVAETITLGAGNHRFRDRVDGVDGKIHTMLAADGKLFVVTRAGRLYCFGANPSEPKRHALEVRPLDSPHDAWCGKAAQILALAGVEEGHALVLGIGTGRLVEELLGQSKLHVVAIDPDAEKVDALRRKLDGAGLYGERVAVHQGNPLDFGLPPYLADLVVSEDLNVAGLAGGREFVEIVLHSLRPYGGTACLEIPADRRDAFARWCQQTNPAGVQLKRNDSFAMLVRSGPLPGAADYTGQQNFDRSVKAPFGLLWFGDTFHHHKLRYKTYRHQAGRGLPLHIQIVDGVMTYEVTKEPYGPDPKTMNYFKYLSTLDEGKSYSDAFIDVYTGRVMSQAAAAHVSFRDSKPTPDAPGDPWLIPSVRRNPITGLEEGRELLKKYGCDQTPVDYGELFTMRSGTPAYYDKRVESGTVNIGGLRSGCRNSIVPACGVLSLPSWSGNCTCNYPVYTSLALVPMPDDFEQWSAWGDVARDGPIKRVGINFGAPGDRADVDGTLWLDFPSVGGPSPKIPIRVEPQQPQWYCRHSLWMQGGEGRPWVTASGAQGIREIRIEPVAKKPVIGDGQIGIRWAGLIEPQFSETYTFYADSDEGARLWINGKLILDNEQNLRRDQRGEVSGTVQLTGGSKADIKLEYYGASKIPADGRRKMVLRWSSPSVPKSVVPRERLLVADDRPGGLRAAYYETKFKGPSVPAVDPQINFDWGRDLPPVLRPPAEPVRPCGSYTVELLFAEPDGLLSGDRIFSVFLQGREVLRDFDVAREAGGANRGVVRTFQKIEVGDDLTISFRPKVGQPLVSGVRLVAD